MSAVLLLLRRVPWQVWIALLAAVMIWWYGHYRYNEGWRDAVAEQQRMQQKAKAGADKETDRLRSGDRSRVMQFDRD